jgi:hypothetical protein
MNIYLIITAGGLLGILGHALQTIGKINRKTPQSNFKDLFRLYWQADWFSFICSFASKARCRAICCGTRN